jgi:flagellar assembly protein FliH
VLGRRSALRRTDLGRALDSSRDEGATDDHPEREDERADEDGSQELSASIPMPNPQALDSRAESTGKVLGRTRSTANVPSHLKPYEQTVIIGGDPRRAAPQQPSTSELEQTAVAAATPSAPPAPAIDQEILARAQMEAQQILQQAQMQAQQMMQEAQSQIQAHAENVAQQAGQQGYQDGMQQGFAAGQEQGLAETLARVEQLKMEFVELVLARRKVLAAMEPEIVHLAVNIAEKIVGMELATGREIITGIVRQALATLKERDEIVIRVNPSEVEAVVANQAAYEAMIEGLKRFEVLADGAIEVGSCAIETNLGNVDARISTQLEAVRAGLDEMCKIRAFEMKDKLATEPVEVPGDPEFHAKILQAEAEAKAAEAAAKAHH